MYTYYCRYSELNTQWDYMSSLYMIISQIATSGGDEIIIKGHVLMIILLLCLLLGKVLGAIIIATAMQVTYATNHALYNYEKVTGELIDVLKNQGLSGKKIALIPTLW